MATVTSFTDAPPEAVFDALSNGWYYSNWVVGTSHMRAVDRRWPDVGSKLYHASGVWPMALRDETEVEEVIPNRRLVMKAKGRPFGEARIEIDLESEGARTRVVMKEEPVRGFGAWVHNPVTDGLLRRRNVEALARLSALAEQRNSPSE
jgi:uncharacterized protein YndB with AHSA1/START domain